MCMRCWDNNGYPEPVYAPPPVYDLPRPKRPRKAAKHKCYACRVLRPTSTVRWEPASEAWVCRDRKACYKRLAKNLPPELKDILEMWKRGRGSTE